MRFRMGATTEYEVVKALAIKGLANGAERLSLSHLQWDLHRNCSDSKVATHYGREAPEWVMGEPIPMWIDLDVRCRRCWPCLQARGYQWECRATSELLLASRTWFCTYTANPAHQYRLLVKAISRRKGNPGPEETFRLRAGELGKEFTLYLKRVRKEAKTSFRYMVVTEKHKSGMPHLHALIHEPLGREPVRYHVLKDQWSLGRVSEMKLVENDGVAAYCAKYLSKEMLSRVRASISYGVGECGDFSQSV